MTPRRQPKHMWGYCVKVMDADGLGGSEFLGYTKAVNRIDATKNIREKYGDRARIVELQRWGGVL